MRKQNIKRTSIAAVVVVSLSGTLTGCNKGISETTDMTVKPVKLLSVKDLAVADSDAFLARIDATYRAQLSFQVGGEVSDIKVKMGQAVTKGQPLVIMEAMKMEHTIKAPSDGTIDEVYFKEGDMVDGGAELLAFTAQEASEA